MASRIFHPPATSVAESPRVLGLPKFPETARDTRLSLKGGALGVSQTTDGATHRAAPASRLVPVGNSNRYVWSPDSEPLGSGFTSTVYRGKDLVTGRSVAVKVVPKKKQQLLASERYYQQLYSHLGNLPHPNLLKLHCMLEDAANFYLISELCCGPDLVDFVLEFSAGAIPVELGRSLTFQILLALHHLHRHDVLHRDVKLDNILFLDVHRRVLNLIDFDMGLLQSVPEPPKPTTKPDEVVVVGTRDYMAPECYGGKYSARSDLWSVGVILFIFLDGHFPFNFLSCHSTQDALRVLSKGIAIPNRVRKKSPMAADLLERLTKLDPTERCQSAWHALTHAWLSPIPAALPRTVSGETKKTGEAKKTPLPTGESDAAKPSGNHEEFTKEGFAATLKDLKKIPEILATPAPSPRGTRPHDPVLKPPTTTPSPSGTPQSQRGSPEMDSLIQSRNLLKFFDHKMLRPDSGKRSPPSVVIRSCNRSRRHTYGLSKQQWGLESRSTETGTHTELGTASTTGSSFGDPIALRPPVDGSDVFFKKLTAPQTAMCLSPRFGTMRHQTESPHQANVASGSPTCKSNRRSQEQQAGAFLQAIQVANRHITEALQQKKKDYVKSQSDNNKLLTMSWLPAQNKVASKSPFPLKTPSPLKQGPGTRAKTDKLPTLKPFPVSPPKSARFPRESAPGHPTRRATGNSESPSRAFFNLWSSKKKVSPKNALKEHSPVKRHEDTVGPPVPCNPHRCEGGKLNTPRHLSGQGAASPTAKGADHIDNAQHRKKASKEFRGDTKKL